MDFKVTKSEIAFRGKVVDLQIDEIVYNATGNKATREVLLHPGGSVILAVKDDGKIVMITQYRYPHKEVLIELPAGKLDMNEDPLVCATRELQEETGYTAKNISKLGKIYTTSGFCNEVLHIYLATELTEGEHAREEGEETMKMMEMTMDEIEEKIRTNEICDAKTICGIQMYKLSKEGRK